MWLWQLNQCRNSVKVRFFLLSCFVHLVVMVCLFTAYTTTYHCTVLNRPLHTIPVIFSRTTSAFRSTSKATIGSATKYIPAGTVAFKPVHQQKSKTKKASQKKKIPTKVHKESIQEKKHEPAYTQKTETLQASPAKLIEQKKERIAEQQPMQAAVVHPEEYDAYVMQEQLQQEVSRCWHPPRGLQGSLCIIAVQLGTQGTLEAIHITQPSGVLAYDISARSAIAAIKFPRVVYGKEVIMTFRQE